MGDRDAPGPGDPLAAVVADRDPEGDVRWRGVLTGDETYAPALARLRRLFKPLPASPRCKLCYAPYGAPFGPIVKLLGYGPWEKNPSLCGACLTSMEQSHGGAEIELSFLFADLRDSTALAQTMSASAYSRLLNAFYGIAARNIQAPGGNVDKYLGDGVFALFIPGFTGSDHAAKAIEAGRRILHETHDSKALPAETVPLAVGIGVHTGSAYVGVLGQKGDPTDFTAIGEAVNLTQRLSSAARARELLISEAAATAAGLDTAGLERREIEARGIAGTVPVWADRHEVAATH